MNFTVMIVPFGGTIERAFYYNYWDTTITYALNSSVEHFLENYRSCSGAIFIRYSHNDCDDYVLHDVVTSKLHP